MTGGNELIERNVRQRNPSLQRQKIPVRAQTQRKDLRLQDAADVIRGSTVGAPPACQRHH